ncbi:unnamed protein product [Spodoptera littoralis]|uniref:Regulatory protein zeste n=1 Tax=Spodoptera littoralis TaxID=7109 RepID=A0A9P0IEG6_SPOLI|nr:unnamed protein product [Spodoptera littoralis]CAH1645373.1 unnamed protein product [Spodoptera littoralis]
MAEKRKRSQNFTDDEKQKLIKLLMEHKDIILSKKTDGATNEAKLSAWMQITATFNATGSVFRSKQSLLKMWEKLKSASKSYYFSTRESIEQAGSGTCTVKRDPILAQVCTMLGHSCTEIEEENVSNVVEAVISECDSDNESLPKVINCEIDVEIPFAADDPLKVPRLWSRSRRRRASSINERQEAMNSRDSGFKDEKKKDADELKIMLLEEELTTKRQLNELHIQAARKELIIKDLEIEIRKAALERVQGGSLPWPSVFGDSLKEEH